MKRIVVLLSIVFGVMAPMHGEEMQVKVAVEGKTQTYKIKKEAQRLAQENAVEKYIKRLNNTIPNNIVSQAKNEASNFITDTYLESSAWEWLTENQKLGQLNCIFTITLDTEKLNQYLEKLGFKLQGKTELLILEEPPSMGQIKLDKAFGAGSLDGNKFYIQNYTQFQRRTRDSIIKNTDKYGLSIKLLADQPEYEKYKTKDSTLLGVFFDPKTNAFAIDKDLLQEIKNNDPDTLVLYYRFDSLVFDKETMKLKVTVAFNIKKLSTGVTKSVGTQSYAVSCLSKEKDAVIDAFGSAIESAVQLLMNDAGTKINDMIMSINNTKVAKGPIVIYINGSGIAEKYRKRVLFYIRQDLVKQKHTSKAQAKIRGNNLTVTTNSQVDAMEFFFDVLSPILEERGLKVDDDKVDFTGNTIKLKPEAGDEEE